MTPLAVVLDRRSAVPLYFQIHQHLLGQIQKGRLKPGQLIPSEQEISSHLGVSRMTARQAVKSLCDAGVAYSRRGLGTFVSASKQEKTSTELLSFTQEIKACGSRPESRVLAFEQTVAENEAALALHQKPGERVLRLVRVRLADSLPMGVETSILPLKLLPGLLKEFDPRTSLYQTLGKRYGIRMAAADEVVEAGVADAEAARLLQIGKGSPVFLLTRVSYTESGQPIEYVRSTYRGDRWKIVSRLTANHIGRTQALQPRSSTLTKGDGQVPRPNHRSKRRAQSGSARSDSTSEEKS